ncbi:addiction module protein [Candidatus Bipolaricaulota bacterium]|nr:addiction module protein [Candidatus Bipolaricaulota bacterium]MCK4599005.1 addiction module protein [Candidatus Bipolaricaulota bacterium]
MTAQTEEILSEALDLSPVERAELVEQILSSFDFPSREEIDALWAAEVEDRIDAYDQSKIKATPAHNVLEKIDG